MDTTFTSDWDKLKSAFAALRKLGFVTNMGTGKYACCGGCLGGYLGDKLEAKGIAEEDRQAVWFSRQSIAKRDGSIDWQDGSIKDFGLYLNWAAKGSDATPIVEALRA